MFSPVRNERGDARGGAYLWKEDFVDAIRCARPRLRTGLNLHGTCHFTHSANLVMGPGGEGEARGTGADFAPALGLVHPLVASGGIKPSPRKPQRASCGDSSHLGESFC